MNKEDNTNTMPDLSSQTASLAKLARGRATLADYEKGESPLTLSRTPSLPMELLLLVLDYVANDSAAEHGDIESNPARCCLVSKPFSTLATPLLYLQYRGNYRHVRDIVLKPVGTHTGALELHEAVFEVLERCTSITKFTVEQHIHPFDGKRLSDLTTSLSIAWLICVISRCEQQETLDLQLRVTHPLQLDTLGIRSSHCLTFDNFHFLTSSSAQTLTSLTLHQLGRLSVVDLRHLVSLKNLYVALPQRPE
ncbi:hypothetical protein JCM8547_002281 [Rhodosporidiobolus lusitaniae]